MNLLGNSITTYTISWIKFGYSGECSPLNPIWLASLSKGKIYTWTHEDEGRDWGDFCKNYKVAKDGQQDTGN
jgi:hypothetical protein